MSDPATRVVNAGGALTELARIAASLDTRPALIRTARAAGVSWPDIAEAARLSRQTVITLSKIEPPTT